MKNKTIKMIILIQISIAVCISFLLIPWLFAHIINGPSYTIVNQSKIDNQGIELIRESFDLYDLPDDVQFIEVKEELDHWFDPNITYHATVVIPSNYINNLENSGRIYKIKSISSITNTAAVEFVIYLDSGNSHVEKLLKWIRAIGTKDTAWRYLKSVLMLAVVIAVIMFPYHKLMKKRPKN